MNENLNLVEILKDVPEGTVLYTTTFGYVRLEAVYDDLRQYPILFKSVEKDSFMGATTIDGRNLADVKGGECVIFPSKEQRDWSKFVPPLKEGAPVMATDYLGGGFCLGYYCSGNKAYFKNNKKEAAVSWNIIIPYDKFDPNNIEESLKYNIVKE